AEEDDVVRGDQRVARLQVVLGDPVRGRGGHQPGAALARLRQAPGRGDGAGAVVAVAVRVGGLAVADLVVDARDHVAHDLLAGRGELAVVRQLGLHALAGARAVDAGGPVPGGAPLAAAGVRDTAAAGAAAAAPAAARAGGAAASAASASATGYGAATATATAAARTGAAPATAPAGRGRRA